MNELEEIMNGKHEIKHLKIDNDTLTFNTELNNYDWNLTPRDIEMIIYALQEDKNNLQSKIDKANEILNKLCIYGYGQVNCRPIKNTTKQEVYNAMYEIKNILKEAE